MSYASLKTLRPFFTNKCGRLLAGGKVYTYEVGTLIPKATYKDAAGLTENTNPIVLDVSGETDIYINSDYRFQIFDRDGVLIDDVDSVAPTQRISSAFLIDESGFNQAQINATKEDTLNKGVANGYASLNSEAKIPDEQISVVDNLTTNNTVKPLSAAMGKKLQDDKLAIADLVNNLITGGTDKALTAEMGKQLREWLDVIMYSPIPYPKMTPPTGFLMLMGQAISQATYPKLYALYGGTLPDMRAGFIRGVDNGRGIDSGRNILSEQEPTRITSHVGSYLGEYVIPTNGSDANDIISLPTYSRYYAAANSSSGVGSSALAVRPRNIAFNYIVKAG